MVECAVNDVAESLEFRPETWGALLRHLDRRLAGEGRVVTAVRFDGVDQPSFRDGDMSDLALGTIARIDVDADDAVALLRAAVEAASDSLPELVAGVGSTAAALRRRTPDALRQLGTLVVALQSLVTLTAAAGTAADLSFGVDPLADAAVHGACAQVESALGALVEHQAGADWDALADALDRHLAPAVAGWSDVLAPIRMRAAA